MNSPFLWFGHCLRTGYCKSVNLKRKLKTQKIKETKPINSEIRFFKPNMLINISNEHLLKSVINEKLKDVFLLFI